jgi:hypothetical protein
MFFSESDSARSIPALAHFGSLFFLLMFFSKYDSARSIPALAHFAFGHFGHFCTAGSSPAGCVFCLRAANYINVVYRKFFLGRWGAASTIQNSVDIRACACPPINKRGLCPPIKFDFLPRPSAEYIYI